MDPRVEVSFDASTNMKTIRGYTNEGKVGFIAMLDMSDVTAAPETLIAAFEDMMEKAAPGESMRGRKKDSVINYTTVDPSACASASCARIFLGPNLTARGCRVVRLISFPGGGLMSLHFDAYSARSIEDSMFIKICGSFFRAADEDHGQSTP